MKGKQYFSSAVCVISLIVGVPVFLFVALATKGVLLGLLCGIATALIVGFALPFVLWNQDRRYRDIEDDIPEEILMKEQISFSYPQNGRGGYLCVTSSALYLFSRDRKPYFSCRLARERMLSAEIIRENCLKLYVQDSGTGEATVVSLLTPSSREILALLVRAGWFVEEE